MPERIGLGEVWTRAIEANVRYYQALGRLTSDYLRGVAGILTSAGLPLPVRLGRATAAPDPPSSTATAQPALPPAPQAGSAPAMVLEAETGGQALGVFLVENRLGQQVSAPIAASAFRDASGREVRPALKFEPEVVTLKGGEQMLVRVMATVDESLEPGESYRGEATVPGLSETRVPLVVRRRTSVAPPHEPAPPEETGNRRRARPRKSAARRVRPSGAARS